MFNQGKPGKGLAKFYDDHVDKTIPNYHVFHDQIIRLVEASGVSPRIWLDTGCGTGTLVSKAAAIFPDTLFLLADPSQEMLDLAGEKLKVLSEDRVKLLPKSSTLDLLLADGDRPDVISAVMCHHYMNGEGRRQATRKCFELLGDGGMYITFENISPLTVRGTEIGQENWKSFQVKNGKTLLDAENHIKRFNVEYFPITIEDHLALLRTCGFTVVEMLWYSYMQAGFYAIK